MKEYMYNIYDEEAVVEEKEDGATTVKTAEFEKEFADYEKAVRFLEKIGYRF